MSKSESQNDSSLYFLSTQIQSRHEDQEQADTTLRKLGRFKNTPEGSKRTHIRENKVKKSKRKKAPTNSRKTTSISAFVRETLGKKKISNTQGILDYFKGDSQRVSDFISEIESATAGPHLLSRKPPGDKNVLFSEAEWKAFVDKLQLRFPNLSSKNKKSLKAVTKQLDALRRRERMSMEADESTGEGGKVIWTQASRQPSSEMTPEDIRWLYDLDEDQLTNETSLDELSLSQQGPSCFTLSQVLGESQVDNLPSQDSWTSAQGNDSHLGEFVEDSEPDMGEFSKSQIEQYMTEGKSLVSLPCIEDSAQEPHTFYTPSTPGQNLNCATLYNAQKDVGAMLFHQKISQNSSSINIFSSIAFAPTCDSVNPAHAGKTLEPEGYLTDSQVEDVFKTPTKWPDHLQISSSPLSSKKSTQNGLPPSALKLPLQDMRGHGTGVEYLQFSPTTRSNQNYPKYTSDVVEFHGHVELAEKSRFILKSLPKELHLAQAQDHISDSEDDTHEVSFIEVMKPVDFCSELMSPPKKAQRYLQVPSSP